MKGKRNVLLTAVVLLLVTNRLPAPLTGTTRLFGSRLARRKR